MGLGQGFMRLKKTWKAESRDPEERWPRSQAIGPQEEIKVSLSHTHTDGRAVPDLKQAWVLPHNSLSLAGVAALISALPLVDNDLAVLSLSTCVLLYL